MAHAIPTPQALGQAARAARKQLGLTQPQLALAAGVGVRFVVELEAGKPTVRLETLLRVLHALGGHLLLDGLPQAPAAVTPTSPVEVATPDPQKVASRGG